jgi:hypothetical protein
VLILVVAIDGFDLAGIGVLGFAPLLAQRLKALLRITEVGIAVRNLPKAERPS